MPRQCQRLCVTTLATAIFVAVKLGSYRSVPSENYAGFLIQNFMTFRIKADVQSSIAHQDSRKGALTTITKVISMDTNMSIRHTVDNVELANEEQQAQFKKSGWIEADDVFTPFTRFMRPAWKRWNFLKRVETRRFLQNPAHKDMLVLALEMQRKGEVRHRKSKELRRQTFEYLRSQNRSYPQGSDFPVLVHLTSTFRSGQHKRLVEGELAKWIKLHCPVQCRATTKERESAHIIMNSDGRPEGLKPWQVYAVATMESLGSKGAGKAVQIVLNYDYYADMPRRYIAHLPRFGLDYPLPPPMKSEKEVVAAIFVSNCAEWRKQFLEELLANRIKILSYGRCLHNANFQCARQSKYHCKVQAMLAHRFSFALENNLIGTYATEKFGHMMASSGVNVYYGSPSGIADFGYPIIEAMDFSNALELADYLKRVSTNRTLYKYYTTRATKAPVDPWEGYRLEGAFGRLVCGACIAYIEKGFFLKYPGQSEPEDIMGQH